MTDTDTPEGIVREIADQVRYESHLAALRVEALKLGVIAYIERHDPEGRGIPAGVIEGALTVDGTSYCSNIRAALWELANDDRLVSWAKGNRTLYALREAREEALLPDLDNGIPKGEQRLIAKMIEISNWLQENDPDRAGISSKRIEDNVPGRAVDIRGALHQLQEMGCVTEEIGPRGAKLQVLQKPYTYTGPEDTDAEDIIFG
ncbi:hypothetical protein [Nocardia flavorosea]|uniref:Uncharacterized protein n=1 Tax=Nocardia flavorosea TaxID=53429 RepID=A0A846YEV4_9NOCA|nr:hypothetical protein [Nocardia flavorosea]NKY57407.1 hypothetical protein [Nocardia flavorosea]